MTDISKTIAGIFEAAKAIYDYKTRFFRDVPRGKTTVNSLPPEITDAVNFAKKILDESSKEASGVFCPIGIGKNNQDIVVAISDGIHDLNDLVNKYNDSRWKFFKSTANKTLAEIKVLSERIDKFFCMFATTVQGGSTPVEVETILTDNKAVYFWKTYIQPTHPEGRIKYPMFLDIMTKANLGIAALKLENMKDEEQSKMKRLIVTPFILERAIKYCSGWDEFAERCSRVSEKNPIMAVVNTNNRAAPTIVTKDTMPPAEAVITRFPGQASFGSFFIMSTIGYVLTTMNEGMEPGSDLAVTVPGERPFQEWSFGKFSHIRHSTSKLCIGIRPGTSISVGCTPCLVEEDKSDSKLQKWRLESDGTIRCAENRNLVLEISAEDIGKEFLRVVLRPYRAGAAEQMFAVVNYAPAFTPTLPRAHIPIPGDPIPYSPTPYSDASIELLCRSYQTQQGQLYN